MAQQDAEAEKRPAGLLSDDFAARTHSHNLPDSVAPGEGKSLGVRMIAMAQRVECRILEKQATLGHSAADCT